MRLVILVFVLQIVGCGSIPLPQTQTNIVYKLDLNGLIDGKRWDGTAIGSATQSHDITIESPTDVNWMRILSCHRFESYPDVIKTGWFRVNRGYRYHYQEAPGIEDTGLCVLRLQAFTKALKSDGSPQGSAYALMLFHNSQFTLQAQNICNGEQGTGTGTTICQSMNGLRQRLKFTEQVITTSNPSDGTNAPSPCQGHFIDAYTWEYETSLGECMVVFGTTAKPHKFSVHMAYGFNTDQYRGDQ